MQTHTLRMVRSQPCRSAQAPAPRRPSAAEPALSAPASPVPPPNPPVLIPPTTARPRPLRTNSSSLPPAESWSAKKQSKLGVKCKVLYRRLFQASNVVENQGQRCICGLSSFLSKLNLIMAPEVFKRVCLRSGQKCVP